MITPRNKQLVTALAGLVLVGVIVVLFAVKFRGGPQVGTVPGLVVTGDEHGERGRDGVIIVHQGDPPRRGDESRRRGDTARHDEAGSRTGDPTSTASDDETTTTTATNGSRATGPGGRGSDAATGGNRFTSVEDRGRGTDGAFTSVARDGAAAGQAFDPAGESLDRLLEEDDVDEGGDGGVYGQVLQGQHPVEGAVLALVNTDSGHQRFTQTGEEGLYRFAGLVHASYVLTLVEPKAPNPTRTFRIRQADQWLELDFLIPEAEPVAGRVIDSVTNTGVTGATIAVDRTSSFMGRVSTEENGDFRLFPLGPGDYILTITAKGYERHEQRLTLDAGVAPPTFLEIRVKPSRVAEGIVLLPDGLNAAGASVALFGAQGLWNDPYGGVGWQTTGVNGRFQIPIPEDAGNLPFQAGARLDGYLPALSASANPEAPPDLLTIQLLRGATMRGRVADAEGNAIPEAEVAATGGFANSRIVYQRFNMKLPAKTTDAMGNFELFPVEPGKVELTVTADGYIQGTFDFTVPAAGMDTGDLVLESSDGAKPGRIFGVIVDENLTPLQGTNVYLRQIAGPAERYANSDSRGGFRFDDLPDGNYVITLGGSMLRGDLWIPVSYKYPFARPGDERIYLVFDLGHAIQMRVVDGFGRAITEYRVGVRVEDIGSQGPGGHREEIAMQYQRNFQNAEGIALVDNLIAGIATITVSVPNVGTVEVPGVRVTASGVSRIDDVVVDAGAVATGRVVELESGNPIGGVEVRAVPPAYSPPSHPLNTIEFRTFSDETGEFRLAGLPAGQGSLVFRTPGRLALRLDNLLFKADEPLALGPVHLKQGAILAGVVRNPEGEAIDEVLVNVATHTLYADAQGRFRADFLPEGDFPMEVVDRLGRYPAIKRQITLRSGETTNLELVFTP